ncbi:pyridoxamine 5'-phosphate oxidase family protein [Oscillatoria sp. FACHB-1407]|uniref:Npun_F5749 family FMN-dependent PPOX-type flavoprotein n=1 Tax=Oscillatoria sp. FACHB-1407 TaxID=2692847 RepID=UPI0016877FCC|nr:Npun_F5749 family FMN-dependent PPOX-type flavoprotein [Oscillatoria sp. FACHB-1407]MBD2460806.1 pyridoxamine 5'-phosphate oxidase family protein [Oscillatoria sp. FACHB-1407]
MTLAPWRSAIARALHRNRSLVYARYLQLATVRSDGRPANRTVVFRGFLDNTNQLKFITDDRSEKALQIPQNAWGEVCWYFPNTREQFRLLGQLSLIDEKNSDATLRQARQRQWQELSDAARTQFAWADPGKLRSPDDPFTPPSPDASSPLSNFLLVLLDPIQVDHLELRGEPQNRSIYRQINNEWMVDAVNP